MTQRGPVYCIFFAKGSETPVRAPLETDVGYVSQKTPHYLGGMMVAAYQGRLGVKVVRIVNDAGHLPIGERGLNASEVGRVMKDAGIAKTFAMSMRTW